MLLKSIENYMTNDFCKLVLVKYGFVGIVGIPVSIFLGRFITTGRGNFFSFMFAPGVGYEDRLIVDVFGSGIIAGACIWGDKTDELDLSWLFEILFMIHETEKDVFSFLICLYIEVISLYSFIIIC